VERSFGFLIAYDSKHILFFQQNANASGSTANRHLILDIIEHGSQRFLSCFLCFW